MSSPRSSVTISQVNVAQTTDGHTLNPLQQQCLVPGRRSPSIKLMLSRLRTELYGLIEELQKNHLSVEILTPLFGGSPGFPDHTLALRFTQEESEEKLSVTKVWSKLRKPWRPTK
ncbi:hypothetical protein J6590_089741 [Homalodisca vitripennis]|nr:hypothetical protein J6590_089741 [Homalodisca vitripennis]